MVRLEIGKKFNKLLILKEVEPNVYKNSRIRNVLVKCDCGVEKVIRYNSVYKGHSKSCGCESNNIKHLHHTNKRPSRTHKSWSSMKWRCLNPNATRYDNWGGRGITICDRWLQPKGQGFINFLEDMGERPEGMTLDRIDNDGNYEPDNCRWATASEQNSNKGSWEKKNKNQLTLISV